MTLNELVEIYRKRPDLAFYTFFTIIALTAGIKFAYRDYIDRREAGRLRRRLNKRVSSYQEVPKKANPDSSRTSRDIEDYNQLPS